MIVMVVVMVRIVVMMVVRIMVMVRMVGKMVGRMVTMMVVNIVFYQYPPSSHQGGWWLVCFCLFIVSTSGPVLTRKGTKPR